MLNVVGEVWSCWVGCMTLNEWLEGVLKQLYFNHDQYREFGIQRTRYWARTIKWLLLCFLADGHNTYTIWIGKPTLYYQSQIGLTPWWYLTCFAWSTACPHMSQSYEGSSLQDPRCLLLHSWTISLFWTGSCYNYYTDTDCYPSCTIPVHRPYTLDIEVTVLSFSYLPHVEFTLYGLTLD